MAFPEQLRKARQALSLTQQQVADKIGITKSTYCGYETGKRQPDIAKIRLLTNVLRISADELLELPLPIDAPADNAQVNNVTARHNTDAHEPACVISPLEQDVLSKLRSMSSEKVTYLLAFMDSLEDLLS